MTKENDEVLKKIWQYAKEHGHIPEDMLEYVPRRKTKPDILKELKGGSKEQMSKTNENTELENWDLFAGDWLKAEYVTEDPSKIVCTGVEIDVKEDRKQLVATVEYRGKEWSMNINRTNQSFLVRKKLMPKDLVGKVFVCTKIQVRNPSTGSMQPSLLIIDLE